jgi:hypothetical protein
VEAWIVLVIGGLLALALLGAAVAAVLMRSVGALLIPALLGVAACALLRVQMIGSNRPEAVLPGAVLLGSATVGLAGCAIALAVWPRRDRSAEQSASAIRRI